MNKKKFKRIAIYDIDGVLYDSRHRYRDLPNGSIDLEYWIKNSVREKVLQDKLLPHSDLFKKDLLDQSTYVVIATARVLTPWCYLKIGSELGCPNKIISRKSSDSRKDWVLKYKALRQLLSLKQFKDISKKDIVFYDDKLSNIEYLSQLEITAVHTVYY